MAALDGYQDRSTHTQKHSSRLWRTHLAERRNLKMQGLTATLRI